MQSILTSHNQSVRIPPSGPVSAKVMIVGEAPGSSEVIEGRPFVGASGQELDKMLHEVGLARTECFVTNVCRVRPPNNEISAFFGKKPPADPSAEILEGLAELRNEIEWVQPNIIVALGNIALWALTGEFGITSWRGSLLPCSLVPGYKVIPTYHPAAILRLWSWRAIAVADLRRAAAEATFRELYIPKYTFSVRPSLDTVLETIAKQLARAESGPITITVDIETRHHSISCIGIAWSPLEALCIPLMSITNLEGYWSLDEEILVIQSLRKLLCHPNVAVVGQNFSYDAQYIARDYGFLPNLAGDTMVMQHVAFAGMPKGLDFLSSMYCRYHVYWKDEGKEWNPKLHTEERHWVYNCKDAVITFEVHAALNVVLSQLGLQSVYREQMKLWYSAFRSMLRGVRIDVRHRAQLAAELFSAIEVRERWLHSVVGYELSPRSPKQMLSFFNGELAIPQVMNRKTGTPTANDEALEKFCKREPLVIPLVKRIREIRSLGVFLSTFVQAELDSDRRMRCNFNIAGTETYRLSSSTNPFGSGTNLQNVPKGDEQGLLPNIRELFIPDPGMTFFDIDLDRADLQVVVWEAEDEELKAALREGADIHAMNAKTLSISRALAKSWVHGTNYGGSARTMAINCGISIHQAELMQRRWFEAHPGILRWHRRTEHELMTRRFVQNRFGYRRFYFDRVEGLLPEALAWQPQSTVANVINRAWTAIDEHLPEVQVLLQVHDSLAGQFPSNRRSEILPKLHALCLIPIPYPEPLTIPCGIKLSLKSWGDCKEAAWEDTCHATTRTG